MMLKHHVVAFALILAGGVGTVGAAEDEGYVGIQIKLDDDSGKVLVVEAFKDSPAEKAGIKDSDLIVKIGDKEPATIQETVETIRAYKPGDKVKFVVRRGGEDKTVEVTIGKRPE
jgi:S1-C subfamily serine protease